MKPAGYWRRLKAHPGVPIAAILSLSGPAIALQRPDGDWRVGLIMLFSWVPVLITARTQPLPQDEEGR